MNLAFFSSFPMLLGKQQKSKEWYHNSELNKPALLQSPKLHNENLRASRREFAKQNQCLDTQA